MKIFFLITVLLFANFIYSESLIVRFKNKDSIKKLKKNKSIAPWLNVKSDLIKDLNIHLLEINKKANIGKVIGDLRKEPEVLYVQIDHPIKQRVVPNDKEFEKQWGLFDSANGNDIQALDAWSLGTGGKNRLNQEVVVAVVDSGVDIEHKDLVKNIWVNKREIPNNNVDDDGNGYIDDYSGWNAFNDNSTITPNYHGTHVAGIVGASGNNDIQVAGVNWNVKVMAVAGASGRTSTVLKAYGYVFKQKKLWLKTGGMHGANVVVTNSSFGVDKAKCTDQDYPAWNDIYDEMGQIGILSAAATINDHVNVDVEGDVPTTCTSEYIISVTNTTKEGLKSSYAGYGANHIDIGAPGTDIWSTLPNNSVGPLSGTSMATPFVAGAIAFLHSIASQDLTNIYQTDPAMGALLFKNILLDSVTSQLDLMKTTTSGGRLNLTDASTMASTFKYVAMPFQEDTKKFSIKKMWSKLVNKILTAVE